jgi:hypothetical protein
VGWVVCAYGVMCVVCEVQFVVCVSCVRVVWVGVWYAVNVVCVW